MIEPCSDSWQPQQLISTVFAGLNLLLLTFLTQRRIQADKRERTNGGIKHDEALEHRKRVTGKLRTRHGDKEP